MAVPAHRETALFKRILQELLSHEVLQRSQSKIPNGADEGPAARALKHQQTTSLKPLYLIFDFNSPPRIPSRNLTVDRVDFS